MVSHSPLAAHAHKTILLPFCYHSVDGSIAVGALSSLLDMQQWLNHPSKRVAAAMDFSRGSWNRSWNSGILLLKPDAREAAHIYSLLTDPAKREVARNIPSVDGDQSFLNWCAAGLVAHATAKDAPPTPPHDTPP